MPDIVVSEFMDEAAVNGLAADFDVEYDPTLVDDLSRLQSQLATARALIVRNRTQVDVELLAAAPALTVVGRLGVGLDNIDLDACASRDIEVFTADGANADSVAEYVIGAMFALARPALLASSRVAAGEWPRQDSVGSELAGRTLGLIGLGAIARLVAGKASALGMRITAHDPVLPPDDPAWELADSLDLEALLSQSDVVSLHVPLLDSTRNLIDDAAISTMKPTALLINASRGGTVDEAAVIDALTSGRLGGAALDVFADEPVGVEQGARFAAIPNLILTPHIAGLTDESQQRVGQMTADSVRSVLSRS